jgi:hypothetical protein
MAQKTIKSPGLCQGFNNGREDQIRTGDPLHPIQVRYRAAPLPERIVKLRKIT